MTLTQIFLLTLAGALIYEGFAWAVGPGSMRRLYEEAMQQLDDRQLSYAGVGSLFLGVALALIAVRVLS